mmetsp:Transcript_3610/g.10639  ORF Transcript_3610/g.10639 Transcript_3610/m.10639 type:complete len:84 (-) Transcript_3610:398-649(-)
MVPTTSVFFQHSQSTSHWGPPFPGEGNFLFGSADRLCFGGLDLGALELLSGILSSFLGVAPVSLHALMQALRGFVIRCGGNVK